MSRLHSRKFAKFFALTLSLAVMFTMCFATTALASEDPPDIGEPIDNPGEIAIDKVLQMPIGTTTPDATFEFVAKKVSLDGDDSEKSLSMMPDLNVANNNILYDDGDTATPDANNIVAIAKSTDNILVNFPGAGVYEYEISEKPNTYTAADNEVMAYSTAVYILRLYVTNNQDSTEISAAGIYVKSADNAEQTVGHKVSEMTFTNTYVKTNKPVDPENPDPLNEATLEISNTVTGGSGNKAHYFDYVITPDVNELFKQLGVVGDYFMAYIVENGEVVQDITSNLGEGGLSGTDEGDKAYMKISTDGETSFKLKDGQKLVFVDTPVGTGYEVVQTIIEGYDVRYTATTDGQQVGNSEAGEQDASLSTGIRFVGESNNSASFFNHRDEFVPTGININNVPFIGLIALPFIGLIAYAISRLRKDKKAATK